MYTLLSSESLKEVPLNILNKVWQEGGLRDYLNATAKALDCRAKHVQVGIDGGDIRTGVYCVHLLHLFEPLAKGILQIQWQNSLQVQG